jgi:hypothetical protein
MFVIEINSQAAKELTRVLKDIDTYKVSVDVRADGVAIKRNEGMWTATLRMQATASDLGIVTR